MLNIALCCHFGGRGPFFQFSRSLTFLHIVFCSYTEIDYDVDQAALRWRQRPYPDVKYELNMLTTEGRPTVQAIPMMGSEYSDVYELQVGSFRYADEPKVLNVLKDRIERYAIYIAFMLCTELLRFHGLR